MPQDHGETYHHDDSTAENEVMNGLMAAKQYENNKPQHSLAAQEEMLKTNFPPLPNGVIAKQMTEDECMQLRASIHDMASERMAHSITNLREQLTEYHSLLDQLSSVTAKYESLEKEYQKRGDRIQSLEQEVVALKKSHAVYVTEHSVRRVSCTGPQGQGVDGLTQMKEMTMQRMQVIPNSAVFQPNVSYIKHHQAPTPFCDMNESPMMKHHQSPSPFCNMSELLQARQYISPSLQSHCQLPSDGGFHPTCYFSSSDRNADEQASGLSATRPKRAISSDCASAFGVMPSQQQGTKRFKNDAFSSQEYMVNFQLPEAV